MKLVTCNRGCGTKDLHWKFPKGKYKLFDKDNLLHVCEDGDIKPEVYRKKATESIVYEVGVSNASEIPLPEENGKSKKVNMNRKKSFDITPKIDPKKSFTITTNSTGIAITGNDIHSAIYIPHIAIKDLVKALVEFI